MPLNTSLRKTLVRLAPRSLYPLILRIYYSPVVSQALKKTGINFYHPTWHQVSESNLKGLHLFLDTERDQTAQLMVAGEYDLYFTQFLKKIGAAGKTFFDVGAHVGYTSLSFAYLAKGKGKVIAFEPNQWNRERFLLHIKKNNPYGKMISIFPFALADKNGTSEFVYTNNIDGGTSSGSFLATATTHLEHDTYQQKLGFSSTMVRVLTLDSFVSKYRQIPDIIKIDVEGAEHFVLQGAKKTLSKYHPILLIELHSIPSATQSFEVLQQHNYTIKILHEESDGRVFISATPTPKKRKK